MAKEQMQIKKSLPIDKYIEFALYDKKRGYYMKKNPFGSEGDFITAPNISVLFSEMITIWIINFWRSLKKEKSINIIELGAGNGEMTFQIIKTIQKLKLYNNKIEFYIYEKSPLLKKIQMKKLKKLNVKWINRFNQLNKNTNLFVCNEFIDSFPIKQFYKKNKKWFEKYINLKNKSFEYKKVNIYKIENKFNLKMSDGQNIIEFSPLLYRTLNEISTEIKKTDGGILIIDYFGYNKKMKDTVQSIKNHKKNSIFKNVGDADITYVPNYNLFKSMIETFDLKIGGVTTQGAFLSKLGIKNRAENLSKQSRFSEKVNIYFRLRRLIDPRQMGDLFKVVFVCKKKNNFKFALK